MNELPRSVRNTMARQSVAGPHPDADLLTAFTEGSATQQERQSVLSHLAVCGECREIVALASPAVEQQTVLRPEPGKLRKWLWIPALGAVAVVTVSTALLMTRPSRSTQPASQTAGVSSVPAPIPSPEITKGESVSQTATSNEVKRNDEGKQVASDALTGRAATAKSASRKPDAEQVKSLAVGNEPTGAIVASAPQRRDAGPLAKQSAEAGAMLRGTPAQSAGRGVAGAISTNTVTGPYAQTLQNQALQNQALQNQNVAGVQSGTAQKEELRDRDVKAAAVSPERSLVREEAAASPMKSRAALPAAAPAMGMRPVAPVPANGKLAKAAAKPLSAQWNISSDGRLERAFPDGPWMLMLLEGKFNAVSSVASEVWAGGDAGALFHSADNGEHWQRVVISDNGVPISSAITGIRFEDVHRGTVQTDGGDTWVTSDAGITWARLRR